MTLTARLQTHVQRCRELGHEDAAKLVEETLTELRTQAIETMRGRDAAATMNMYRCHQCSSMAPTGYICVNCGHDPSFKLETEPYDTFTQEYDDDPLLPTPLASATRSISPTGARCLRPFWIYC